MSEQGSGSFGPEGPRSRKPRAGRAEPGCGEFRSELVLAGAPSGTGRETGRTTRSAVKTESEVRVAQSSRTPSVTDPGTARSDRRSLDGGLARAFGEESRLWRTPGPYLGPSADDVAVFLGRATPRRSNTLLRGVSSVPPGHTVKRDRQGEWHLVRNARFSDGSRWCGVHTDEIADAIHTRLVESVRRLAQRHGRIGLLLSGGLDSTILAVLLQRAGVDLVAYLVEHEGRSGPKEWRYASHVADHLRIPLKRVVVRRQDLLSVSDALRRARPQPHACWVSVNHHLAAQRAFEDRRDALVTGIGSDEIFGGYHKIGRYAHRFSRDIARGRTPDPWSILLGERCPARTRLLYIGQACPFTAQFLARLFPDIDVRSALEDDVVQLFRELTASGERPDITALMLELEMELRTSDVLVEELRCASALAEIRTEFPFLDPGLIGAAANIPVTLKYRLDRGDLRYPPRTHATDKYILRRAFEELVPAFVLSRPRMTYTLPFAAWLRDERILRVVRDTTNRSSLWRTLGARRELVAEALNARLDGDPWGAPFRVWMLYQLAAWWESDGGPRLYESARVLH